jgi:hypothetical protein
VYTNDETGFLLHLRCVWSVRVCCLLYPHQLCESMLQKHWDRGGQQLKEQLSFQLGMKPQVVAMKGSCLYWQADPRSLAVCVVEANSMRVRTLQRPLHKIRCKYLCIVVKGTPVKCSAGYSKSRLRTGAGAVCVPSRECLSQVVQSQCHHHDPAKRPSVSLQGRGHCPLSLGEDNHSSEHQHTCTSPEHIQAGTETLIFKFLRLA